MQKDYEIDSLHDQYDDSKDPFHDDEDEEVEIEDCYE